MGKLVNALKKRALQTAAVVGVAPLFVASAMAQDTTSVEFIDIGVSASSIAEKLGQTVGPWVVGAFGIAGTVFAVKFGWRLIRNFASRS